MPWLIFLVAALFLHCDVQASDGSSDLNDKEVLDILLHNKRYDPRIKPPSSGAPLRVNISVVLLSLSSPDESSLHYEVEFLMHQRWIDPRLAQKNTSYSFLNGLHHHGDIWKPDIYFIKHGTFKENLTPSNIALRIFWNGTVLYSMRRHLVLNCEGDLHIFPFDSPMCTFSIESVSFTSDQMEFHWAGPNRIAKDEDSGNIALSPVLKRHNAYLVHNETFYCDHHDEWRGDYSCLKVRLHFTRDKAFYVTTVFIPGIILVSSSFLTFWFEWNAVPARTMLGVTTMLNFFTTSNGFRSNLPVVSNLTAMNLWDAVCMFFIYTSFLEFVVMNYLARWVQDPDEQKKKRDNAILDSLQLVTTTLDLRHPDKAGTLGGQLHSLGGNLENKFKEVRHFGGDMMRGKARAPFKENEGQQSSDRDPNDRHLQNNKSIEDIMSDSTVTNATSSQSSENDNRVEVKGRYSMVQVKKIDVYSRRIFPSIYGMFVLYFFIRYHAIEGAMSIGGDE
eukprot:TRINITY_DN10934_c0_g1_i1.p1 TRINITY_DN10934_c0_g1~~TRINITY_DN10934_c0_g1_i1.p1  ORF type:complete len:504 (+),score=68.70 TRINITY_DN10934_c0_g1_i1:62-1573(+)